jgi:hypothetical protein
MGRGAGTALHMTVSRPGAPKATDKPERGNRGERPPTQAKCRENGKIVAPSLRTEGPGTMGRRADTALHMAASRPGAPKAPGGPGWGKHWKRPPAQPKYRGNGKDATPSPGAKGPGTMGRRAGTALHMVASRPGTPKPTDKPERGIRWQRPLAQTKYKDNGKITALSPDCSGSLVGGRAGTAPTTTPAA